ncbi:hypothetical protein [Paraflavisolibacter caeni]|uniref:hypothetical protein n=1 Tax=Paraflavisolibacter caeni TaxID=2982496 RepID=UPI00311B07EC
MHPQALNWLEAFVKAGWMRGKLTNGSGNLPYISPAKLKTGFTLKKETLGKWEKSYVTVEVFANSAQNRVAAYESSTPGFILTDIFVGTIPPLGKNSRWKVTAFCTNLFNVSYYNHLSLIKTIGVREPGRNIGLQWRYEW